MRFLADENIRKDTVEFLKRSGFPVDVVPRGASDSSIAARLKKEPRVFLTCDSDFANTLTFPPKEFSGILIFRIHPPSAEKFQTALQRFLSVQSASRIAGRTFVIDEKSFLELR